MAASQHRYEQQMVADLIAGDKAAIVRFVDQAGPAVWPTVLVLAGEGQAANEAFLCVIAAFKANNFARLARYDGRSRLSTFLTLVTRDVLGEEVARLFPLDRDCAWRRFDRLFARDIRARIRRRFPRADETRQQDLFQEIAAKLLEQDCRRIRAYDGRGSFCGYILLVVDRLLIDLLRQEAPRRRLPAEIARLPELHKLLFAAGAWRDVPLDPGSMAAALQGKIEPLPAPAELAAALEQVVGPIAAARGVQKGMREIALNGKEVPALHAPDASAEEALIEREADAAREALLDRVRRATESLPADQQLYLHLMLEASDPMPAREIAREMVITVEEVYRLQQQTRRWMKKIGSEVQKNAGVSV